jgi:hypothetical protein
MDLSLPPRAFLPFRILIRKPPFVDNISNSTDDINSSVLSMSDDSNLKINSETDFESSIEYDNLDEKEKVPLFNFIIKAIV